MKSRPKSLTVVINKDEDRALVNASIPELALLCTSDKTGRIGLFRVLQGLRMALAQHWGELYGDRGVVDAWTVGFDVYHNVGV